MSDNSKWVAYQYTPTKVGAIVAFVLFGIATIVSIVQFFSALFSKLATKKSRRRILTLIPFIIGGLFEFIGYIGRMISHDDKESLSPFIMQSILLLVAPALFAATIYMTLGRIIEKLDCEKYSVIPLKWLTKVFVIGDVISFFLQGGGGGIQASNQLKLGEKLIIIGLFVQIAFFGLFIIVLTIFQYRVFKNPTSKSIAFRYSPSKFSNWQTIIITLIICSILILIRSIVRAIEFIQGNDGYIISKEIFLYMLDGLPMFLTMVIFNIQDIPRFYNKITLISEDIDFDYSMDKENYSTVDVRTYT